MLRVRLVLHCDYGLLEVVVGELETTEKRGAGMDTEALLEVTLATIEKSAFGTSIVVSEGAGVLDFEDGVVDVMLLLTMVVVLELPLMLALDVEAFVTDLELVGVSDVDFETAEVVRSELAGLAGLEVGVVDTVSGSAEEVCLEVKVVELLLELKAALTLDVDVVDGASDAVELSIFDVGELELIEAEAAPVDLSDIMCVLLAVDVVVDLILEALDVVETGNVLVGAVVELFPVPETGDPWVVIL